MMSKKYCISSFLIIFFSIFFLISNIDLGEAYRIGDEEKEGSAEDFTSDLRKKIHEEVDKGLSKIGEELEKAVEIAKSAIVITISRDSEFIHISKMEEWTKESSPLKEDKVNINNIGDRVIELYEEERDLTKVILVVDKDTRYEDLWKAINIYEKSLHNLEDVDVNNIRYIFAKPLTPRVQKSY